MPQALHKDQEVKTQKGLRQYDMAFAPQRYTKRMLEKQTVISGLHDEQVSITWNKAMVRSEMDLQL
jgi:hypothetical protein